MVKKLIKYDFASYMRLLIPIQLAVLGIAAINRVVQIFENYDNEIYGIIFGSSVALYVISMIVALVLTVIIAIVRFYQGMYSNEGYLSHTLPVTPTQHIFSKLIVSMLFMLGTLLTIFVSLCIVTLGEMNIELFKSAGFLLAKGFERLRWNLPFYIAELLALMIISFFGGMLMMYFCISVGQLAKKHKILAAVGVYFGIYVLSQIIGTVFAVYISLNPELFETLGEWIEANTEAFFHIVFCIGIVLDVIMTGVYFFFTRLLMTRKLNLT